MKCIHTLLLFLAPLVLFAQEQWRYSEIPIFDSAEIVIQENVQYGIATHAFTSAEVPLLVDLYYPNATVDSAYQRPLVLCIHGGGFIGGDKSELNYQSLEFARRGFVVANINYRVGWNCDNVLCVNCYASNLQKAIYCAVQDARAALRYCCARAEEFRINTARVFINGQSAGSIAGTQCAIWNQEEANSTIPADFQLTAGGINESGNADQASYSIAGIINQCGAIDNLDHYDEAIPIIHFHDANDCVVPFQYGALIACFCNGFLSYNGSGAIHNYLQSAGKCSQLHTAPQVLPNHCTYPQSSVVKQSACFMKSILNGYCVGVSNTDVYASPVCSFLPISTDIIGCTYESAANFNPSATTDDGSCDFPDACNADLNADGLIGVEDLIIFLGNFGQTCGP